MEMMHFDHIAPTGYVPVVMAVTESAVLVSNIDKVFHLRLYQVGYTKL